MKKLLLFISLLVSIAAQAYEPMIREDRIWEYVESITSFGVGTLNYYTMQFDGTEEVNGTEYHVLKQTTFSSWEIESVEEGYQCICDNKPTDTVVALLREDDGVIYLAPSESTENQEIVIYDFRDKNIGDSFTASGNKYDDRYFNLHTLNSVEYEVISKEPSTDNGSTIYCLRNKTVYNVVENEEDFVRQWVIDDFGESYADVYIAEGVGNIGEGIFLTPLTPAYMIATGEYSVTSEFNNLYDLEGNIIYKGRDSKRPVSGIDGIEADRLGDGRMYDLMGREIRNPLPGTIYIQNGEKHIAR